MHVFRGGKARGGHRSRGTHVSGECMQIYLPAGCTHVLVKHGTERSDARSRGAQSCGYHSSRVPQWLLKPLDLCTATRVASARGTWSQHSSNGRPRKGTHKFPQEQHSSAIRRRTKRSTSPGARGTPYASASVPRMHCASPAGRTRPRSLGSPTSSLTRASGHDVACDSPAKENVGYVMVRVN